MKLILYLSDYVIPLTIFYIVGFGLLMKRPVYDDFVRGAREGVVHQLPYSLSLLLDGIL